MFNLKQPRHISTLPIAAKYLRCSEMTRSAKSGLMHCSKQHRYSMTGADIKATSAALRGSNLFFNFYIYFVGDVAGKDRRYVPNRIQAVDFG
jgi:hypothetical protein